jgi:hypothetical protein
MRLTTAVQLALALAVAACTTTPGPRLATAPDDSPEPWPPRPAAYRDAATYGEALRTWRTPEDVSAWVGARFSYDASRAILLSESARSRGAAPAIHRPADFFAAPSGMCLDLARFAVETLAAIDGQLVPAYLMIEFEPATVAGETIRLHWLAMFRRDGRYWFVGDSKRPGHVAGPYASVEAFVDEYSRYRQRKVIAFRETASFERRQRTPANRTERQPAT